MGPSTNLVGPLPPTFNFDNLSFVMWLNNDSKAYRNLAMELIFLCRFFVQAHKQSLNSSIRLRNVLIAADDALKSVAEVKDWTSEEVDKKFVKAIHLLGAFEKDFSSKAPTSDPNIGGMVTSDLEAKMDDTSKSPSAILYALKNNLHAKPMGNERPKPTRIVRFHLLSFLPDAYSIAVKQVLGDNPSLQEILWNFSRFKDERHRLTLRENPHFYAELPTSRKAYGNNVKIDPTEDFRHANEFYVLIGKPELLCIMTDQVSRSFGNFWCPNNAIIFKDTRGRLMGASIVKASLTGTCCEFCKRLRVLVSTVPRCDNQLQSTTIPIPNFIDFGLCVCLGRAATDSLFLVPFPPTSEQPEYSVAYRTHIHMLDNDSLLQIFSHYRLNHEEDWNLRQMWQKLAHVCRKWRYLIYDSSSHLDMCLLLTNDSPSIDTLSHLPPLPLIIDYSDRTETVARKDEGRIHLGLQQHDLVCRVILEAPSSSLRIWLELMNKLFPRLENLSLLTTTVEETNLTLPETLEAPDLRHLSLHGIGLPTGLPLLSSAVALSKLSLTHIGASCYFSPGHLVTQLQSLPLLEELSIGFAIPIPLPSSEGRLLPAPIPPVRLPTLRRLTYRGVDVYIDNLIAQINTPLLERLSLTLFFDLAFTLVNLTEFIHRTEGFGCLVAQVNFHEYGASIDASYYEPRGIGKLNLHVNCEPLEWQIDSATQVCIALGNVLSAVEELTIDLDECWMSSDWENSLTLALDSMVWHELLLPFIGVKKLHIGSLLTFELSQSLELVTGGLVLELLPELQNLEVHLEIDDVKKVFSAFIESREAVGRPVHLLALPIPYDEPEVPLPDTNVPRGYATTVKTPGQLSDQYSSLQYKNNTGGSYRIQAMCLISICQTLIQAEQTFCSRDELIQLRGARRAVDDVLKSVSMAGTKTSKEADAKFKRAIEVLSAHEMRYHSKETVARRMATAETMDKYSPTILNKPKKKLRPCDEMRLMTVEFLLHKSLLDHSPVIVKQVLGPRSDVSEVLWNFSRYNGPEEGRLTLRQNPRFYNRLPTLPEAYMGEFRMDPIQTFQHERISVLIDNSRRSLFLETAGRMQVFDDIWDLNACIIFKDVRGKLVGDSVVGAAIQGVPNLWCFMNLCDDPPLAPSPTVIPTQITSAAGLLIRDWRKAIRLILRFPGANIHITDKPFLSSGTGSRIDTTLQSRRRLRPLTRASQLSTTVGPG